MYQASGVLSAQMKLQYLNDRKKFFMSSRFSYAVSTFLVFLVAIMQLMLIGCEDRVSIELPLNYYPSVKRLTPENMLVHEPTVSKKKIAFAVEVEENYEIHTMDLDGSNIKRITYNDSNDYNPAFSPDGNKIAYISFIRYGQSNDEIFEMDVDGNNQKRLTDNAYADGGPAFSPDGKSIAFEANKKGNGEIYIMDADGKNAKQLTYSQEDKCCAAFSPNGRYIAYSSYFASAEGIRSDIYIMDIDGKNQERLVRNGFINSNPAFSPDGRFIVFDTNRDGNSEIYIMQADGENQTRLTNNDFIDNSPVFLDNHRILFVAHRSINDQLGIFVMDLLQRQ